MFTKEEFVQRAVKVHGERYDYAKSAYKGNNTKVVITCREHGDFEQLPSDHWRGRGCRKCVGLDKGTTEAFIDNANKVHGKLYDYSSVDYKGNKEEVLIGCQRHGQFKQSPNNHLKGQGCPKCKNEAKTLTQGEFVERAGKVHGRQYDYSKVVYQHNQLPVTIICPKHGEFTQLAIHHLYHQSGCPTCSASHGERKIRDWLLSRGMSFKQEFKFSDCRSKQPLPFDFAVFTDNGLVLIEHQGKHHYLPVSFGGTTKAVEIHEMTKRHDEIKKRYCQEQGYRLIEVRYDCQDIAKFLDGEFA
jgi:Zn finger protein HypA/HybF involved in hydrogenase expression